MNTVHAALKGLVADLHGRGRLRVWSLVITVFGDAIAPRGGRVPLSTLQDVVGRLGVEAGALRTALSRLAADGWVCREKEGRTSVYALDSHGHRDFDRATRRIYAPGPPHWDGTIEVALAPPGVDAREVDRRLARLGFVEAGAAAWLRPLDAHALDAGTELADLLVVRQKPGHLPPGLSGLWNVDALDRAYSAFAVAMSPLLSAVEAADAPCLLDAIAARILLIHDWRRIVLHDPGLPAALLPTPWAGDAARDLARRIYARLAPPSEAWLDQAGLPPVDDSASFARRFGIGGG